MATREALALPMNSPCTPGQPETYISPEDIFVISYLHSLLLLGPSLFWDIVTPEEDTTLMRQHHFPIPLASLKVQPSVPSVLQDLFG